MFLNFKACKPKAINISGKEHSRRKRARKSLVTSDARALTTNILASVTYRMCYRSINVKPLSFLFLYLIANVGTNKLSITVPVPLGTLNHKDLKCTATAPLTLRHSLQVSCVRNFTSILNLENRNCLAAEIGKDEIYCYSQAH